MAFYYLHDKKQINPKVKDCKFIYYCNHDLTFTNELSFTEEPETKYCIHKITDGFSKWEVDDEFIDVLGHENTVKARFKKTHNFKNFELWINEKFNK